MKTRYIIIALVFISNMLFAQDELNTYLKVAAENNPGLKAKFSEYMAAMEKVPQVGALPDLQLAFGYFIQPVETRLGPQQAKVSLTQAFPWFGTLNAKEDVATEKARAKFERFEEARRRLLGYGRAVEVLEPDVLRKSIKDYAEQIVDLYSEELQ